MTDRIAARSSAFGWLLQGPRHTLVGRPANVCTAITSLVVTRGGLDVAGTSASVTRSWRTHRGPGPEPRSVPRRRRHRHHHPQLANTLYLLIANQGQWALLREQPNLGKFAFDESLWHTSTVRHIFRTPMLDTDIAGIPVSEGQKIMLVLGAANQDPERWGENASAYDITRDAGGRGRLVLVVRLVLELETSPQRPLSTTLSCNHIYAPSTRSRTAASTRARVRRIVGPLGDPGPGLGCNTQTLFGAVRRQLCSRRSCSVERIDTEVDKPGRHRVGTCGNKPST